MDSELLLKFIGYFPDYLLTLSRTIYAFFGQPLSKQLYMIEKRSRVIRRRTETRIILKEEK